MEYRTRDGQSIRENDSQDAFLERLYGTRLGRTCVKLLIHPALSELGGRLLSTRLSCFMIRPFIRKNHIDMTQYEQVNYTSYNDFFTRKVRKNMRLFDRNPNHLVSPCDGKLMVYPVSEEGILSIKHTPYTVQSLLRDGNLAQHYIGGTALVFRLTVDDYHRFFYIDSGRKSSNRTISGVYHTVNPVANDVYPIYKENHREYSLLASDHFGTILMMEVGALMVGRIVNHHEACRAERGMEKGYFEFGGSTIVLLFEPDTIQVDEDILVNTREGIETVVKAGEKIGGHK